MIRKGIYSIDEVLSKILPLNTYDKERFVDFDGDMVSMISHRYHTFNDKGIKCVTCGIEGKFFAKEKHEENVNRYHFNLYAVDENGKDVLMTKDHIIRKREGGRDILENYQTMCTYCNAKKG